MRTTSCPCHLACPRRVPQTPRLHTGLQGGGAPPYPNSLCPCQVLETAGALPAHTQYLLPALCHLFLSGARASKSLLWQGAVRC